LRRRTKELNMVTVVCFVLATIFVGPALAVAPWFVYKVLS